MTKLKSKKMTKSTFAIIIMAIAMVAMLAFGGTYAFFTATADSHTNNFSTGIVELKDGEVTTFTGTKMVDGDTLLSAVTYDVGTTDVKTIVIVNFDVSVAGTDVTLADLFGEGAGSINTTNWKDVTGHDNFYYQVYDPAAAESFVGTFISSALVLNAGPNWVEGQDQPAEMGATINLTLAAESIQYDHLTGDTEAEKVAAAYTQLFGA